MLPRVAVVGEGEWSPLRSQKYFVILQRVLLRLLSCLSVRLEVKMHGAAKQILQLYVLIITPHPPS